MAFVWSIILHMKMFPFHDVVMEKDCVDYIYVIFLAMKIALVKTWNAYLFWIKCCWVQKTVVAKYNLIEITFYSKLQFLRIYFHLIN